MNINDVIFSLLREALFNEEMNFSDALEKDEQWNEIYSELQSQAVLGVTSAVIHRHREVPEELRNKWSYLQRTFFVKYCRMAAVQNKTCLLLQEAGITVAVMKGMAAAIYYPVPENRTMGDIDLLVRPEDYRIAIDVLKNSGYVVDGPEEGQYHTAFLKQNVLIELHRSPAGLHISDKADEIREYILSGLDHVEINELGQDRFPILPWKQNGMELIWHIRQHLYNGLGLRQIIDWMMFVNYILDDEHMKDYMLDLRKCGLDQLAIAVTKMCQKYLGLTHENITWCDSADEDLCDELMSFVMEQGNFGEKATDEKAAKVVSGYSNPKVIMTKLQEEGKQKWALLKKLPILTPFAFIYGGAVMLSSICEQEGGVVNTMRHIRLGKRRKKMLSRLYGKQSAERPFAFCKDMKKKGDSCKVHGKTATILSKEQLRNAVNGINNTSFSVGFKVAMDVAANAEYLVYELICAVKGYRMPSKKERECVRKNVTFMYKSFERQKMAKELYRNIQKFYPGTQVVIADDSRKPLKIAGKYVTVINLPFNSGLSFGLNRALERVITPYVVRIDDDCLLTRRSLVGEQIRFLNKHSEIDLVGFGLINALRLEKPQAYTEKYYPQSMSYAPKELKIPHMTRIDENHLVLGKVANLFLVRTKKLKEIGYDDNIRMIDHDDFFYRAAGNIVSVIAENTRIFHRHNLFDGEYLKYRNDIIGDIQYIDTVRSWEKH